jgi:hypothetical protein
MDFADSITPEELQAWADSVKEQQQAEAENNEIPGTEKKVRDKRIIRLCVGLHTFVV